MSNLCLNKFTASNNEDLELITKYLLKEEHLLGDENFKEGELYFYSKWLPVPDTLYIEGLKGEVILAYEELGACLYGEIKTVDGVFSQRCLSVAEVQSMYPDGDDSEEFNYDKAAEVLAAKEWIPWVRMSPGQLSIVT